MTPERYQQIGQLYHEALELAPPERAAFLDRVCAGDEGLRREVESLLAADEQAADFIDAPAFVVAAEMLAGSKTGSVQSQSASLTQTLTLPFTPPAVSTLQETPRQTLPGTSMEQATHKPRFFWLVLAGGALTLASFVVAVVLLFRYSTLSKDFGWEYAAQGEAWHVAAVDPRGAAAGKLQAGDQLLAINGETQIARLGPDVNLYLKRDLLPPNAGYTVRVKRGATEQQFTLDLPLRRDYRNLARIIPELIVGLAFFVLALLVGLLKPGERVTQWAYIAGLLNALNFVPLALFPMGGFLQGWARAAHFLLFCPDVLTGPVSFHFFMLFPPGVSAGRFWVRVRNLYYLVAFIQFIPRTFVRLLAAPGESALLFQHYGWLRGYVQFDGALFGVIALLGIGALCAVIARNYRQVTEPDQRRRLKWIIYGAAIGILPSLLHWVWVMALVASDPQRFVSPETNLLTQMLSELASLAIPLTLGMAIFKHRLFDIRVVIRRGLQYLLAKNVLRAILFLPLAGLVYTIIVKRNLTVSELLFHNSLYFYVIALASLGLRFQKQLSVWIDRRFFREAYDRERILLGLIDEVKKLDSITEISQLVSRELEAALHPSRVYVFYRAEERRDLRLGYSSGGSSQGLLIPESFGLLRLAEEEASALDSQTLRKRGLPAHEQAWLDQLGASLIVPLNSAGGRLDGLLLLGEKKSEEPYSPDDRKLLQAVAGQMAVVYENAWLKQRIEREQKQRREVLARLSDEQINLLKECPACGACYDASAQNCAQDGHELILPLPVERVIDGKYRLEQLLGKGGMGAVYEATDLRLERKLALKLITGNLFGDRAALRRFEREARASARLNHPNIVTVYDYGSIGDGAYLAMELLRGVTLRAELKRCGELQPALAACWFEQILEGVKVAHAAGVIHRDLKPENVLITLPGEQVKLLDFGLAKLRLIEMADPSSLTGRGVVMGTFGYMPPEQLTGEEVDERGDIFALGVMVVEALTGSRPFRGRTYAELLHAILRESFHLPAELRQLDAVLQRCLAKDRGDRFASVVALQAELIPALLACPPRAQQQSANDDEPPVILPTD